MKKRYLLYSLLVAFLALATFTACEDNEENEDVEKAVSGDFWESLSGLYRGKMVASIDGVYVDTLYQQVTIASDNRNRMTLSLSSLVVDDMIWNNIYFKDVYFTKIDNQVLISGETVQNLGQLMNVSLTVHGIAWGGSLELTLVAQNVMIRPVTLNLKAEKMKHALNSEAEIVRLRLNHPLVIGQPSLYSSSQEGVQMVFYVPDTLDMDSTEIFVRPEFELSKGATITYPDSLMNFAKTAVYTVWAEDSIHRMKYTVLWAKAMIQQFAFGRWQTDNGWDEPVSGWGTNNGALKKMIDQGKYSGDYAVKRVKGWNVGDWAAEMRTVMTGEGNDREIFAGAFFQGYFDLTLSEPLYGPVYGVSSMSGYAPNAVEGYYKYLPADQVYEGNALVQDTVKVNDTCCIRAILYEIVNPDDHLDSLNYLEDPRVVAVAEMGTLAGKYQPDYQEFSIYFKYIRSYFPSKRYKIALICSSSRDADRKRGAPGSVLTVGGIEVMYASR